MVDLLLDASLGGMEHPQFRLNTRLGRSELPPLLVGGRDARRGSHRLRLARIAFALVGVAAAAAAAAHPDAPSRWQGKGQKCVSRRTVTLPCGSLRIILRRLPPVRAGYNATAVNVLL